MKYSFEASPLLFENLGMNELTLDQMREKRLDRFRRGHRQGDCRLACELARLDTAGAQAILKARDALAAGRAIIGKLVEQRPNQAQWKQDLAWFDARFAEREKTSPKKKPVR